MSSRKSPTFSLLLLYFPIAVPFAEATIRRVDPNATGTPHDGSSWNQAYTILQSAINDSSSTDEVWVVAGTYKPGAAMTDSFSLKSGVGVYGGFAGTESTRAERDFETNITILSGDIGTVGMATDNCYHVVTANAVDANAILDGFTIRDGYSMGFGGSQFNRSGAGIYVSGATSSPQFLNCIIRDNECTAGNGSGAGLWAPLSSSAQGTLKLDNCQFIGNKAGTLGGGAYIVNMAETTITGCRFENNQSTLETGGDNNGGGLYISGATTMTVTTPSATLLDCVFEGNKTARGSGGGIWCGGLKFVARRCDFIDNEAKRQGSALGQGGGMYAKTNSPTFTLIQCRFIENRAIQDGSFFAGGGLAIAEHGGDHKIIDCEFIANSTDPNQDGYGGGLLNLGVKGTFDVVNCLFAGNSAAFGAGIYSARIPEVGTITNYHNCTIAENNATNSTG